MVDLNDARLPPNPTGGWSTQIRTVPNAIVAPVGTGYLVHDAGVFDADGSFVHEAVLWRGRPLLFPGPTPEAIEHLPGRWIWGGVLVSHFGHFLTESTGRLWSLDAVKGHVDGIIFIAKRDFPQEAIDGQSFQRVFFDLVGVDLPIKIARVPTRVDVLEVPGQGFGIGYLMTGTDNFRTYIRERFAKSLAPDGAERLYVSRSKLPQKRGGIIDEVRLEQYHYDCGYEIFHPQDHSLEVQVARYKAARYIVSPDGSALHLVALLSHPDQQVAIIKRRATSAAAGIVRHVTGFAHNPPLVINAITHFWIRSDREFADISAFIEMDFGAVGQALKQKGFIPETADWKALPLDEVSATMEGIASALLRNKISFRRVPIGAPAAPAPQPAPKALSPAPAPAETKHQKRARRAAKREKRAARS